MEFRAVPSPSPADVDGARKRTRSGMKAWRKFRIVASTVVACNRFRVTLEVDAHGAEEPEQAQSEVLAALLRTARLDEQSSSEGGSVVTLRHEGLCTTHPEDVRGMFSGPSSSTGFLSTPDRGHPEPERERSEPYKQVVKEMFTVPHAGSDFLYSSNQTLYTTEGEESGQFEQGIQHVQNLLDEPDVPSEGVQNPPSVWSDWGSLDNLLKADGNSQHFMALASDLNDEVTKKIQDLDRGSGRAKVHKLVEGAEGIIRRMNTVRSSSEAKKNPSVREVEQSVKELFEEMQLHVNQLASGLLGPQKQQSLFAEMSLLIDKGRKAMCNLGRGTDWISEKLKTFALELKRRELIVDQHFQKCAESIPALVQSFLHQRKTTFVSIASVTEWYFEEQRSRDRVEDISSPSPALRPFHFACC